MKELTNPNYKYKSELAEEIDRICINRCLEAVEKTDRDITITADSKSFSEVFSKAIEELNKPEYNILSHPSNAKLLRRMNKKFREINCNIIYSPLVDECAFILVRNDGTAEGSACAMSAERGETSSKDVFNSVYVPKVVHPELITKITRKN